MSTWLTQWDELLNIVEKIIQFCFALRAWSFNSREWHYGLRCIHDLITQDRLLWDKWSWNRCWKDLFHDHLINCSSISIFIERHRFLESRHPCSPSIQISLGQNSSKDIIIASSSRLVRGRSNRFIAPRVSSTGNKRHLVCALNSGQFARYWNPSKGTRLQSIIL